MYKKIAFATVGLLIAISPLIVSAQSFGVGGTVPSVPANATIAQLETLIVQLTQILNQLLSSRQHQNGQPYATIDQQTLTQSTANFGIDGLTSASNIFVVLVSSSYTGPTDYNSISNLLKGSGQYDAVGNTAYVGQKACTSTTQNCWDAAFSGVPIGSYTVYVYDGDGAPQWTLLTTGTLTVSSTVPLQPSITITSPVGTASWTQNTVATWTWTSSGSVPSVDIYLEVGNTTYAFATSYPNGGSFQWTVGAIESAWSSSLSIIPNGTYSIIVCPAGIPITLPQCGQFSANIGGTAYVGQQYQISYISPAVVNVGSTVTLYGSNFDQYALVSLANQNGGPESEATINPTSITPTSITFVVPATNASLTNSSTIGANTVQVFANQGQGGGFRTSNSVTLYVSGTPTTSFTASPTSGMAPLAVNFTAIGSGSQAVVNFGDGTTGSPTVTCFIADPLPGGGPSGPDCGYSHTYQSAGTYTATLTASNGSLLGTATVNVNTQSTNTVFSASPTSGTPPLSVTFTASGSNVAQGETVNFGDGTSGTLTPNPIADYACFSGMNLSCPTRIQTYSVSHTYQSGGTYTATLVKSGCPSGALTCSAPVQLLGTAIVIVSTQGGLTISPAQQPANSLAFQAAYIPFTRFTLTNTGSATISVTNLTVEREGTAPDAAFNDVSLWGSPGSLLAGGTHLSGAMLNSNHQATIPTSITVAPGGSQTFEFDGDMATNLSAYAGQTATLSLIAIGTSAQVSGTLPITGATHTINASLNVCVNVNQTVYGYQCWASSIQPAITSITPTSGTVGTQVTISGTYLDQPAANLSSGANVRFSNTSNNSGANVYLSFVSISNTQIVLNVPSSLVAGTYNVYVMNNGGTSNVLTFTINAPSPNVTYVSNSGGSVTGSYANLPTGSQIIVVNQTSGQAVSGISSSASGNGSVILSGLPVGTFYLKAVDASGNYLAQSVSFTSSGNTQTVTFTVSPQSGVAPLSVGFTATGAYGTDLGGTVRFGDGSSGTLNPAPICFGCNEYASVSHTYTSAGTYTATLVNSSGTTLGTATITVTAPVPSSTVTYVSNSGGSVTASYANVPAGSQIIVINQTSGQAVSGVSATASGSGTVTLNNLSAGTFYLKAVDAAGNYLAQSVSFTSAGSTSTTGTCTRTVSGSLGAPTTITISGGASACTAYCSSQDSQNVHSTCVYNDLSVSGSGNANLANALTGLQSALQGLAQWLGK